MGIRTPLRQPHRVSGRVTNTDRACPYRPRARVPSNGSGQVGRSDLECVPPRPASSDRLEQAILGCLKGSAQSGSTDGTEDEKPRTGPGHSNVGQLGVPGGAVVCHQNDEGGLEALVFCD